MELNNDKFIKNLKMHLTFPNRVIIDLLVTHIVNVYSKIEN